MKNHVQWVNGVCGATSWFIGVLPHLCSVCSHHYIQWLEGMINLFVLEISKYSIWEIRHTNERRVRWCRWREWFLWEAVVVRLQSLCRGRSWLLRITKSCEKALFELEPFVFSFCLLLSILFCLGIKSSFSWLLLNLWDRVTPKT